MSLGVRYTVSLFQNIRPSSVGSGRGDDRNTNWLWRYHHKIICGSNLNISTRPSEATDATGVT